MDNIFKRFNEFKSQKKPLKGEALNMLKLK